MKATMKRRYIRKEFSGLDRPILTAILGKQSGRIRIAFVSFCFFLFSAAMYVSGNRRKSIRVH